MLRNFALSTNTVTHDSQMIICRRQRSPLLNSTMSFAPQIATSLVLALHATFYLEVASISSTIRW